jgi:hypothetical protein
MFVLIFQKVYQAALNLVKPEFCIKLLGLFIFLFNFSVLSLKHGNTTSLLTVKRPVFLVEVRASPLDYGRTNLTASLQWGLFSKGLVELSWY